jgi:hypothetical protein
MHLKQGDNQNQNTVYGTYWNLEKQLPCIDLPTAKAAV